MPVAGDEEDRALAAELAKAAGLVEVRDPDGMVVGYFAPLQLEHATHYTEVAAKSTAYRVKTMSDPRPSLPTAEVVERLKSVG